MVQVPGYQVGVPGTSPGTFAEQGRGEVRDKG